MRIAVKRTKVFERKAKKLLRENELKTLEDAIAQEPEFWPVIPGTGGIRKARHAAKGRGKRGGIRAAYYLHTKGPTVYMLTVYAKNERSDLSESDKAALKQIVKAIKAATDGDDNG